MSQHDNVDVKIRKSEVEGVISAPPSKSYTHRAFFSSALSKKSKIANPLIASDTLSTLKACVKMGAFFVKKSGSFYFRGTDKIEAGYYNCENSGTSLRILISLLSLSEKTSILDGDESLRKRPNLQLVESLIKLNAKIYGSKNFQPPIRVKGPIHGGEVEISAVSSQFITSLLFALPLTDSESIIRVKSLKSRPYVDVTLDVLERSGIEIQVEENAFLISPSSYNLREFSVPPDFSSLSYLISAGVLAGRVEILDVYDSRQGDKRIVDVVREMGGEVRWKNNRIVAEKSQLEGISFDAGDTPDLVPTVAVLASVAKGESEIYNAEHLRIKETDRIKTVVYNLRKLGIEAEEREDGMRIVGGKPKYGIVESYGDHRIAMAFSILGLVNGIVIRGAECVRVSYPDFFEDLRKIGAGVEVL